MAASFLVAEATSARVSVLRGKLTLSPTRLRLRPCSRGPDPRAVVVGARARQRVRRRHGFVLISGGLV
jgi:hypothetical protein